MSLKATTDAFLAEVLSEEPRYPRGTVFVDIESPNVVRGVLDAVYEGRPFLLVYPDGHGELYTPGGGRLRRLIGRLIWPLIHDQLAGDIEQITSGSVTRRTRRPRKAAPPDLRRVHYRRAPRVRQLA
jgi:hypothetical protein